MNEIYYINFKGKVNVPSKIDIGHNYKIIADCSVVSEQKSDLENGEFAITSKMVPITCEVVKSNGETIKAADPRKNSQKIRNYLFKHYANEGYTEEFDAVYDAFTLEVLSMMPQLLRQAVKRVQDGQ